MQIIRTGARSQEYESWLDPETLKTCRDKLKTYLKNDSSQLNVTGAKAILEKVRNQSDSQQRKTIDWLLQEIWVRESSEINVQGILQLIDDVLQ